jgi:hypothetical protein
LAVLRLLALRGVLGLVPRGAPILVLRVGALDLRDAGGLVLRGVDALAV